MCLVLRILTKRDLVDLELNYPQSLNSSVLSLYSFSCLHPRGRAHRSKLRMFKELPGSNRLKFPRGYYYPHGIDDTTTSASTPMRCLGLTDFLAFNLLVLFTQRAFSSMTIKLCVALGSIVLVQLGQIITVALGHFWSVCCMPGLPVPVIAVSMYCIVVDALM